MLPHLPSPPGGEVAAQRRVRGPYDGLNGFSLQRFAAILTKEFIQMRRDRVTFGMMIGLPLIQLFLFGFAINADPRHLPTLVEMGDNGPLTRAVIAGMQQSDYFDFRGQVAGDGGGRGGAAAGRGEFRCGDPAEFRARRGARTRAGVAGGGRCVGPVGGGRARPRRCRASWGWQCGRC